VDSGVHEDLIPPLNSLAMVRIAWGQADSARPLVEEALAIARSRHHPMLDQVLTTKSELELLRGHLPEARLAIDEARDALRAQYGTSLLGGEAWRGAVLDCTEAEYLRETRQVGEAERLLLAALPRLEARFGMRSLYTDRAVGRLVSLYTEAGQEARAAPYRKRLAAAATRSPP
jgi:hypothetical protein